MASVTLSVDEETRVGAIEFDRTAYNHEFMTEFRSCIDAAGSDSRVRVVTITNRIPGVFCFGADANAFQTMATDERIRTARFDNEVTGLLPGLNKPVIAAVNGTALGGGLEIALACDFIVLARTILNREGTQIPTPLGLPEVKLGLMPGNGGTQRLARRIGRRALFYAMTGANISPEDALAWGLVDRLVDSEKLGEEVATFAALFTKLAPLAVAAIKRATLQGMEESLSRGLAIEAAELREIFASRDAQEGLNAFFEKPRREPIWTGN